MVMRCLLYGTLLISKKFSKYYDLESQLSYDWCRNENNNKTILFALLRFRIGVFLTFELFFIFSSIKIDKHS